mmetsp:Transcript_5251/g.10806  ORF Transcript_5251/g.10806 Transcript_5251/m.10806 type:complete len:361 (-) Transcript_5251:186-1268(-)|eukprot:CAMPEP_0168813316 /NCGR_PEP_ID=MMETSP0726-20121227/5096_1 /TAXON_ID=265536 /ORGANISM="Amphiprora sp., Strain CCMP467" /LENGTH=360 /DNA_ID=CAMNT_0008865443 /DNA_START=57 /DNA_END=1139 /DNA_ORIENTATION=-
MVVFPESSPLYPYPMVAVNNVRQQQLSTALPLRRALIQQQQLQPPQQRQPLHHRQQRQRGRRQQPSSLSVHMIQQEQQHNSLYTASPYALDNEPLSRSSSLSSTISTGETGGKKFHKKEDEENLEPAALHRSIRKRVRFSENNNNDNGNLSLVVHKYDFPWNSRRDYWYTTAEMEGFRKQARRDTKAMVKKNSSRVAAAYVEDFRNLFYDCQQQAVSPSNQQQQQQQYPYQHQQHHPYRQQQQQQHPYNIHHCYTRGRQPQRHQPQSFTIPAECLGLERFQKYIKRDKQGILAMMRQHMNKNERSDYDSYEEDDEEDSLLLFPDQRQNDDDTLLQWHCERLSRTSRLWAQHVAVLSWKSP